jgi:N-acetylmuramoyl-L-alanine amidase
MLAQYFTLIRKCLAVFVSVFIILAVFAVQAQAATGVVTASVLNIRQGPGTNYTKVGSLLKGAQVEIVGQNGAWSKIRLKSGITGWVNSSYLKTSTVAENTGGSGTVQAKNGTVTGSVVNVRGGAGTQYAVKGKASRGTKVTILGQQSSWLNVRLDNGVTGWIHADYVQISEAPAANNQVNGGTSPGAKIEVTGNTVNLRAGPGTNYDTRGQVKKGEQLPLLGEQGGWYRVQTSRGVAYLAGWLARVLTTESASAEEIPSSPGMPEENSGDTGTVPDPGPEGYEPNENESPVLPEENQPQPVTVANRVVLDPGHGGHDSGAIGYSGSYEKDVNLSVAKKAAELLRAAGYEVLMTREDDRYLSLNDRVDFANSSRAAAFVSIHSNGSTNPETNGTEVYYYIDQDDPVVVAQAAERARFARIMQDNLLRALGRKDNGVRDNKNFVVIRYTQIPAILVEIAYLTNLGEEVLLNDPAFQDRAAQAIANGIMEYLGSI